MISSSSADNPVLVSNVHCLNLVLVYQSHVSFEHCCWRSCRTPETSVGPNHDICKCKALVSHLCWSLLCNLCAVLGDGQSCMVRTSRLPFPKIRSCFKLDTAPVIKAATAHLVLFCDWQYMFIIIRKNWESADVAFQPDHRLIDFKIRFRMMIAEF